ncbi:NAD(P)-binding protein [Didymella exigua CBS 183.55]|uniref:NAD(P)-binding protein n=1 Tax=Didymella exigua CBS 183.55 TaxID=1150837 RepID=A0A6A5S0S5_9PLEO|nr:NAD(P)-binding protein [Didymella exigua CBS 183.55]KAF1933074.1 NAD(P)-binding protein [Didymella exigua CBS 183.55]
MSAAEEMVIILTGASRGIGLTIAHHILSQPAQHKVVVTARTASALQDLQTKYGASRVEILASDASSPSFGASLVRAAHTRFGRLDSIIINHGSLDPVAKVGDTTAEQWRDAYATNVFSAVDLIRAALPSLRETRGRVVVTSSGAATGAYQGWAAYGSGKAVLNHVVASLGVEEADVVSVSVRPGVVDTEMQRAIREEHKNAMSASDQAKFHGLHSEGKLVRPEQPGGVIANLALRGERALSGKFLSWDDESLRGYRTDL